MADLINQLVQDQWRCFATSSILILLLLWLATGRMRLAFVALIPNILPVFLVLALVGFTGGKINMGAAMIAAVSVGLSIDGSVHFLAGYQRTRRRKHTAQISSRHAAGRTGVPILLATAALMVGFGVMSTSDFVPTATFGALVASTLAIGTVVNLTLLPAFVVWASPAE
jgi:predicted RND superfamily exporter protein